MSRQRGSPPSDDPPRTHNPHTLPPAPSLTPAQCQELEWQRRLRYEGLGEAEAGAAREDPFPPEAMPASVFPPHDLRVVVKDHSYERTGFPSPPPASARPMPHSLLSSLRARLQASRSERNGNGNGVVNGRLSSQFAANQQPSPQSQPLQQQPPPPSPSGDLKENPIVTEDLHRHVHMGHEMLAGSMASVVSRFCVAPLDVLKIRFQIQEQASKHRQYTSVAQAFASIYRNEGIQAFWKGNAAAELMVVPYGAVSFLAYSSCKSWFPVVAKEGDFASYQHLSSLVAGSFAGLCATVSTYPLDLLRTRFAAQQQHRVYTSLWHAATHIVEREGIGGLYVGITPTLIGIVPLMALQFGCYEAFKQGLRNAKAEPGVDPNTLPLSFVEQSTAGFSAGVISKFLTMPLDVIKKRFQVSGFEIPQKSELPTVLATSVTSPPLTVAAETTSEPPPSTQSTATAKTPHTKQHQHYQEQVLRRRRRRHDQPVSGRRPFTGVWDCARGILAHEGVAGLFKGSVPSILKAGPNSAIIYMVYEYAIRWLNGGPTGHHCDCKQGNGGTPAADANNNSGGDDAHKFKP